MTFLRCLYAPSFLYIISREKRLASRGSQVWRMTCLRLIYATFRCIVSPRKRLGSQCYFLDRMGFYTYNYAVMVYVITTLIARRCSTHETYLSAEYALEKTYARFPRTHEDHWWPSCIEEKTCKGQKEIVRIT